MVTLNIGLNDKDTQKQIDINFSRKWPPCISTRLEKTDTVLSCNREKKNDVVTIDYINNLLEKLNQDCIAVKLSNGNGYLIHHKNPTKYWGDFNDEYFIPITKTGGMPNNFFR